MACNFYFSDNSNEYFSIAQNDVTKTITNKVRLNMRILVNGGTTVDNVTIYPQIEVGSSSSSFEPYNGNTYPINLGVKNLFDKSTANLNKGVATANGGLYNSDINFSTDYIEVKTNGTYYTASGVSSVANRVYGAQYDSNKQYIGGISTNAGVKTFYISNANTKYIRLTGLLEEIDTYQIEEGSKQNSYTPYGTTPIELCKIGNYQDYFGKSNGRNLYVNDKNTHTFQQNNASWRFIDGTGGASGSDLDTKTIYKARVYNGITYTFSSNITASSSIVSQIVYEDETLIKRIDGATATFNETFTASRDGYVILRLYVGANISVSVSNVMLNEGSTALPYEPYGVGKWYLHKEIERVVLNGSERGWGRSGSSSSDVFVGALNLNQYGIGIYSIQGTASSWLVNRFSYGTLGALNKFNVYNPDATYGYNNIGFGISTDIVNDIDTFKTWVSSNNIVFHYLLATPTNTEITYQPLIDQLNLLEKAMSKDGQTNISQVNNDLPFIISASALKEWQESTSLNSTLSMVNPLSLGNTLNTQENNTQPIEVDNIEPLEEEENE